jgi:hypothetical protein
MLLDYDEFNIYTTLEDVENYVEKLLTEGFEIKEEIYNLCLNHFGNEFKLLIDKYFEDED